MPQFKQIKIEETVVKNSNICSYDTVSIISLNINSCSYYISI